MSRPASSWQRETRPNSLWYALPIALWLLYLLETWGSVTAVPCTTPHAYRMLCRRNSCTQETFSQWQRENCDLKNITKRFSDLIYAHMSTNLINVYIKNIIIKIHPINNKYYYIVKFRRHLYLFFLSFFSFYC